MEAFQGCQRDSSALCQIKTGKKMFLVFSQVVNNSKKSPNLATLRPFLFPPKDSISPGQMAFQPARRPAGPPNQVGPRKPARRPPADRPQRSHIKVAEALFRLDSPSPSLLWLQPPE